MEDKTPELPDDYIPATININDEGRTVIPSTVRTFLGITEKSHVRLVIPREDINVYCVVELDDDGRCTIPQPSREVAGIDGDELTMTVGVRQ